MGDYYIYPTKNNFIASTILIVVHTADIEREKFGSEAMKRYSQ